jgi:cysteine desulfurase/selenocysteine lyase
VKDKPAQPEANPAVGNPFAAPLDRNTPHVPGTVAQAPDFRAPASGNFLELTRPLDSAGTIPVVAPASGQRDLIADLGLSSYSFDVEAIRRDFPILNEVVNGHRLIWLDNGATTQKPQSVIDRISYFYEHENSNVHRAARATDAYESAREKTRRFLNAGSTREIVFVRGATEAINLIAQSWGRQNIQRDDEIVITWLEHHANIVPWQMLCAEKGARLRVVPVDDSGQVLLDEYEKLLGPKTRLVSITHVSNALGTVVPVKEMVEAAHRHGARTGCVAHACRCAGHRLRLLRFFRSQGFRANGNWRRLRKVRGLGQHASLAGRRQHDSGRHLREDALPAAAATI